MTLDCEGINVITQRLERTLQAYVFFGALTIAQASWSAGGNATEGSTAFLQAIDERLGKLALRIDLEADKGIAVSEKIGRSPPSQTRELIKTANTNGSKVAQQAQSTVEGLRGAGKVSPLVARSLQQTTLRYLNERSKALKDYSQHLTTMRERVASATPGDALALLDMAYVPRSVGIVLSPSGEGTSGPIGPTSPFSVPSLRTEIPTNLLPFIVVDGVGLGGATVDYPAVGALLAPNDGGGYSTICTVTLIAVNAVLTANHCTANANVVEGPLLKVFFQHAGIYQVEKSFRHQDYAFPYADFAILILANPVSGITPATINDLSPVPANTLSRIVGFGWYSEDSSTVAAGSESSVVQKAGIKVHANVVSDTCTGNEAGQSLICWTYKNGERDALFGSTCHGDSGGPLFVKAFGVWRLAGVTSGGITCRPGDRAVDGEVFAFSGWIKSVLADNPPQLVQTSAAIEFLQPVENDPKRFIVATQNRLFNAALPSWRKTFAIDSDLAMLRITATTTPSRSSLQLVVGQKDGNGSNSCEQLVDDTVVSCEFATPPNGDWQISLTGDFGQEFQVVATKFGKAR